MRARERSPWRERERVYREREYVRGERVCTGRRRFESETRGSQTRESRRLDATNVRFETRSSYNMRRTQMRA